MGWEVFKQQRVLAKKFCKLLDTTFNEDIKMTGGAPEVRSDKSLTLLTVGI